MRTLWLALLLSCTVDPAEDTQDPPPGFDPTPWISGTPARPFPVANQTVTGHRLTRPDNRVVNDLRAAYDAWRGRYLVWTTPRLDGAPRLRVRTDTAPRADTVSEGQGYGMLLTVWFAGHDPWAQVRFDGLWRYAADHRSTIDDRLMDWHVPSTGRAEPGDDNSAFDGDADIAYALLLADAQWGSAGLIDYRAAALRVIAGLHDSTLGPQSHLPLLGDWVDPNNADYSEWTPRTSDWMPAHFRAFAAASGEPDWTLATDAVYASAAQLQADHAPGTGLLPDFATGGPAGLAPAPSGFLESLRDGAWSYNAVRFPWRFGADALYHGDPRAAGAVTAFATWARNVSGTPDRLASTYTLQGVPDPGYRWTSSLFQSTTMVACAVDPQGQVWMDAAWARVSTDHEGYFEDSVSLLAMLTTAGRAWLP